jgi:hypothetical protein
MALDHDKRRRDIAWITIDLIAREGIEVATVRRIASCSTTAITHCSVDKQELLSWAFPSLWAEGEQRFTDTLQRDPADIIGALLTVVPWCPANIVGSQSGILGPSGLQCRTRVPARAKHKGRHGIFAATSRAQEHRAGWSLRRPASC